MADDTTASTWGTALGNVASTVAGAALNSSALSNASNLANMGSAAANAWAQNAYASSAGNLQPYIQAGQNALSQYGTAVSDLYKNPDQIAAQYQSAYDTQASRYDPYIQAGLIGTAAEIQALQSMQNMGSARDYYNQSLSSFSPYIEGTAGASTANRAIADQTAAGYSYNDFQNSPYYQALQQANKDAVAQLQAQGAASGMYGSGNVANALGQKLQSQYANYYGTAQQANLQQQQAASNMYQQLIANGMNAQQAAYTVAQQQMNSDLNKYSTQANTGATMANRGLNATSAANQYSLSTIAQQNAQQQAAANTLANEAQMGQTAATNLGSQGINVANIMGQNAINNASYQAELQGQKATSTGDSLASGLNALNSTGLLKSLGGLAGSAVNSGINALSGLFGGVDSSIFTDTATPYYTQAWQDLYNSMYGPSLSDYLYSNLGDIGSSFSFDD